MSLKKLSVLSVGIFLISIIIFGIWFFDESAFSDPVIIFFSVILPVIGLTAAFLSKKGALKIVGFVGNLVVLLFSVILPAASTLFWNQP